MHLGQLTGQRLVVLGALAFEQDLAVHAKLAALLIELADQYGVECDQGVQIGLKITHQEMANLIGSTRETISLTLAQFKKKQLLDLLGRTVVLLDQEGLQAMT